MNPPASRPPARQPDPTTPLADVTSRLRQLRPAEPDAAASERVWRRISAHVDGSERALVVARLKSIAPADPAPAVGDRAWGRLQAQLRQEQRRAIVPPLVGRPRQSPASSRRLHPTVGLAGLVLIVTLVMVNSVAQAALPGSAFYPVKRAWEAVQWSLTLTPEQRADLALILAGRRRAEAEALVDQGASPALVAATLGDAVNNLDYAAGYAPPAAVTAQAAALRAAASDWPPAYDTATGVLDDLLGTLPVPTSTPAPIDTGTVPPVLTAAPAVTLPPVTTVAAPTAVPTQAPDTSGLPLPTLPLPTVVLPTLVVPTLDLPEVTLPPLLGPTATRTPAATSGGSTPVPNRTPTPLIGLPTSPLPTVEVTLPALLPSPTRTAVPPTAAAPTATRTPAPPTATRTPAPPTATHTPIISLPTLPLPTLPLPTVLPLP